MATVKVSELITRAKTLAQDVDYVQWTLEEWLGWYAECILTISGLRPDAYVETRTLRLKAGSHQKVPDDAFKLLDIICNTESGRAMRPIERELLYQQYPSWPVEKGTEPHYFTLESLTPREFYVFPAAKEGHEIQAVLSLAPPKPKSENDIIAVDDWYAPAIVDYLLYRAYLKNAEFSNDLARANHFIQSFYARINGKFGTKGDD